MQYWTYLQRERERERAHTYMYLHLVYACIYMAHLRTFVITGALDIMHVAKRTWGGIADPAFPESEEKESWKNSFETFLPYCKTLLWSWGVDTIVLLVWMHALVKQSMWHELRKVFERLWKAYKTLRILHHSSFVILLEFCQFLNAQRTETGGKHPVVHLLC